MMPKITVNLRDPFKEKAVDYLTSVKLLAFMPYNVGRLHRLRLAEE